MVYFDVASHFPHLGIDALSINRTYDVEKWYLLQIINGFRAMAERHRITGTYQEFIRDKLEELDITFFEFYAGQDAPMADREQVAKTLAILVGILIAENGFGPKRVWNYINALKDFPYFHRALIELLELQMS